MRIILLIGIIALLVFYVPAACGKITVPLDVSLTVEEELSVGKEHTITISVTSIQRPVQHLTGSMEASGVVSLVNVPALEWHNLPADEEVTAQATFRINELGEGEIMASVYAAEEAYGNSAYLFFLVTEERILTGISSITELKVRHLQNLRNSGAITEQEYQDAIDEILGGGAIETGDLTEPDGDMNYVSELLLAIGAVAIILIAIFLIMKFKNR